MRGRTVSEGLSVYVSKSEIIIGMTEADVEALIGRTKRDGDNYAKHHTERRVAIVAVTKGHEDRVHFESAQEN